MNSLFPASKVDSAAVDSLGGMCGTDLLSNVIAAKPTCSMYDNSLSSCMATPGCDYQYSGWCNGFNCYGISQDECIAAGSICSWSPYSGINGSCYQGSSYFSMVSQCYNLGPEDCAANPVCSSDFNYFCTDEEVPCFGMDQAACSVHGNNCYWSTLNGNGSIPGCYSRNLTGNSTVLGCDSAQLDEDDSEGRDGSFAICSRKVLTSWNGVTSSGDQVFSAARMAGNKMRKVPASFQCASDAATPLLHVGCNMTVSVLPASNFNFSVYLPRINMTVGNLLAPLMNALAGCRSGNTMSAEQTRVRFE